MKETLFPVSVPLSKIQGPFLKSGVPGAIAGRSSLSSKEEEALFPFPALQYPKAPNPNATAVNRAAIPTFLPAPLRTSDRGPAFFFGASSTGCSGKEDVFMIFPVE